MPQFGSLHTRSLGYALDDRERPETGVPPTASVLFAMLGLTHPRRNYSWPRTLDVFSTSINAAIFTRNRSGTRSRSRFAIICRSSASNS